MTARSTSGSRWRRRNATKIAPFACRIESMTERDLARFVAKIRFEDRDEDLGECWIWHASARRDGYGQFNLDGSKPVAAHKVSYQHFVGAVPVGLELDHLCRHRRCVNPRHLDTVTRGENLLRGVVGRFIRTEVHRAALRQGWVKRRASGKSSVFPVVAYERSLEARRGKPLSEAHRAKLRAAWVRRKQKVA